MFCTLEERILSSLRTFVLDSTHTEKAKLIATMTSTEDVKKVWCIAAADFDIHVEDEEIHDKLC